MLALPSPAAAAALCCCWDDLVALRPRSGATSAVAEDAAAPGPGALGGAVQGGCAGCAAGDGGCGALLGAGHGAAPADVGCLYPVQHLMERASALEAAVHPRCGGAVRRVVLCWVCESSWACVRNRQAARFKRGGCGTRSMIPLVYDACAHTNAMPLAFNEADAMQARVYICLLHTYACN